LPLAAKNPPIPFVFKPLENVTSPFSPTFYILTIIVVEPRTGKMWWEIWRAVVFIGWIDGTKLLVKRKGRRVFSTDENLYPKCHISPSQKKKKRTTKSARNSRGKIKKKKRNHK
jgi:hypothetical protein